MAIELNHLFDDDDDEPLTTVRLKARRALRKASELLKDNSLLSARRHLEATRDALQAAHMEILRLLEAQDAMNDDDKSTAAIVRKARLDRLDGMVRKVGDAAAQSAPVALGGGAHTVAYCRDRELRRLRTLQ